MKICIIVRGPIRPNKETVLENIKLLKDSFSLFKCDILFATWKERFQDISYLLKNINPNYLLIENIPNVDFEFKKHSFNPKNCFLQFYLANKAIDFAISKSKYDFIVMTRTDLKISIDPKEWIKDDFYVTIHSKQCGELFTNDQFGIAQPNIMQLFWKYSDYESFFEKIDSCLFPEQIIDHNIERFNLKVIQKPTKIWEIKR